MTTNLDSGSTGEAANVTPLDVNVRRLPDFIEGFEQYASVYNSAPRFVKAAAIWMLSTSVLRSVAMQARGNMLCPNMFLTLVAGPGGGKSQAVKAVKSVLIKATNISIIPASITRAGLEDYMLGNLQTRFMPSGEKMLSNECIGLSEEMQGILPDQDLGHLTLYNILYDLPSIHKARTRSHGEINLEQPYCSILTGAQPAFLATTMPEQAWGMGFMSRNMLVFDVPSERKSAFTNAEVDYKLQADLIHDLRQVSRVRGWVKWTDDARRLYEEWWVRGGGQPIPTAKRLQMGYNARRELHFFKLSIVMCLSRTNDLTITMDDAARAIETLLEFEANMKHVFTEMGNSGSMVAIEDIIDLIRIRSAQGELTHEADVITMLMQRFPSNQVHATVENLIASNAIQVVGGINARGFRKFGIGASPVV